MLKECISYLHNGIFWRNKSIYIIGMNSHLGTNSKEVDIYLHAAYFENYGGVNLKIWEIANKMKKEIKNLELEKISII